MQFKESIVFKISDDFKISVSLMHPLDSTDMFDDTEFFLEHNREKLSIYANDLIIFGLESFCSYIGIAIANEIPLHESIKEDIGYMWNKDLHATAEGYKTKLVMEKGEKTDYWVGQKYLLWSSPGTTTWLYNKGDRIFLHVTPTYKWNFDSPEKGETFISYKDYMKAYKPYYIINIKKNVAQKLLKKVETLIKIIRDNSAD
ncbi:hypothetical protein HN446_01905 [bacterium]|jgi:hypothetical protein|nr:hypothetical protein [bacterium]